MGNYGWIVVIYFNAVATVDVLTASNNDLSKLELYILQI